MLPCVLSTNCRYVSVCIRRSCNHQCIFGTLAATRSSVRPSSSFVVLRAVAGAHNGEIFKIDSIYIIKNIQLSNSRQHHPKCFICTLWNFKIYLVYLIFCLAFLSICIDVLFTVYGRYLKNKKFNYYLTDIHYIHIFNVCQTKVLWRNKLYLLSQHLFIV